MLIINTLRIIMRHYSPSLLLTRLHSHACCMFLGTGKKNHRSRIRSMRHLGLCRPVLMVSVDRNFITRSSSGWKNIFFLQSMPNGTRPQCKNRFLFLFFFILFFRSLLHFFRLLFSFSSQPLHSIACSFNTKRNNHTIAHVDKRKIARIK